MSFVICISIKTNIYTIIYIQARNATIIVYFIIIGIHQQTIKLLRLLYICNAYKIVIKQYAVDLLLFLNGQHL